MNTARFSGILMVSMFALLAAVGTVQAMDMTTGDSMMKKDDVTMTKDAMMTKDMDLMYGSHGEAVTTLQTFLEAHNFLVIPSGVAKGYFGPLTQSALMKYQASVTVPATGYYGPITRGAMSNVMLKSDTVMKKDDTMMKKDDAMMKQKTQ